MREIKFRGKRPDTMEWAVGSLVECFNGKTGIVSMTKYSEENGIKAIIDEVYPDTIGQYTGLKDKNGEEICEGDVLTDKFGSIGVVEWQNGCFVVNFGDEDSFIISDCFDDSYQMWAIGNMHDNPELLKGVE